MSPASRDGTNLSPYSLSLSFKFAIGVDSAKVSELPPSGSGPSLVAGLESGEGVDEDPGSAVDIPKILETLERRRLGDVVCSSSESLSAVARRRFPNGELPMLVIAAVAQNETIGSNVSSRQAE